jgi:N-acetylmuramoyl-L-alanine amidase
MSLKLVKHRIKSICGKEVPFVRSPNIGGQLEPKYLVIHYTAGQSAEAAVSWLTDRKNKVSAHIVIARDGSITQLVPFNRIAYHAGVSSWDGLQGLNNYSIGIELDNAGRLKRVGDKWRAWFDREYSNDEVMEAVHKHGTVPYGWHLYTQAQIESALELGAALFERYDLIDVMGHDDIAPRRKWDPGPAFPMHSFRSRLLGRAVSEPPIFTTVRSLHVRSGPGYQYDKLLAKPLLKGIEVEVIERDGMWCFVDVLEEFEGDMDIQGWVLARHIMRKDLGPLRQAI